MTALRYDNYCGEIDNNGQRIAFMPATLADVEQLAEMYSEVSINESNYKVKLDPRHGENFSHAGGMFQIHTPESIEKEIREGVTCFGIAKDRTGRIEASMWFGGENPHFEDFKPENFLGCKDCDCAIVKAREAGTLAFPRELIVRPGRFRNMAHVMFYTVFNLLRQSGYTHSVFEVYAVRGYRYKKRGVPVEMLNQRSFDMCCSIGGKFFGSLPDFDVVLTDLAVTVSSKVFCYDYAARLPELEQKLRDAGITIAFDRREIA